MTYKRIQKEKDNTKNKTDLLATDWFFASQEHHDYRTPCIMLNKCLPKYILIRRCF